MKKGLVLCLNIIFVCVGQDVSFSNYSENLINSELAIKMIPIQGGTFRMGSPVKEKGRKEDEGPVHEITIDDFWIAEVEISWDIYALFLNRNDEYDMETKGNIVMNIDGVSGATQPYVNYNKPGLPVINVTQYAASQFCKWLTAKTGRYYRLPTEAEWEYACRGGRSTPYSFGENVKKLDSHGWHKDNSAGKLNLSKLKEPNPYGLYDMHGNAAEWVLDSYDPEAYIERSGGVYNPIKKKRALYPRVIRGGSFKDDTDQLRSAARSASTPIWKQRDPQMPKSLWWHTDATHVGFRIVRPKLAPTKQDLNKLWVRPQKEY